MFFFCVCVSVYLYTRLPPFTIQCALLTHELWQITRQTVHNAPILCLAAVCARWWRKSHLSKLKCPAAPALLSITTSTLMQNHFPEVIKQRLYKFKFFFQSFRFAPGYSVVSVIQLSGKKGSVATGCSVSRIVSLRFLQTRSRTCWFYSYRFKSMIITAGTFEIVVDLGRNDWHG